MNWFRIHNEARTDRKLDTLTDAQHRVWFNLMCMASDGQERGSIEYESLDLLALEVSRGDVDLLKETLSRLVTLRIVTTSERHVDFVNWEKRQYDKPSDSPEKTRERKAAQRARQAQSGTNPDMSRPVTPDPSRARRTDTDTDTDTEQRREEAKTRASATPDRSPKLESFPALWESYPRHDKRLQAERAWVALTEVERLECLALFPVLLDDYRQREKQFVPQLSSFLNGKRWRDEPVPRGSPNGNHSNGRKPNGPDFVALSRQLEGRQ